jgi:hypothetical protein
MWLLNQRCKAARMNASPIFPLNERYDPGSEAWQEEQSPPIVRFWCDDGVCWGIPFRQVTATHYNPKHQSLLIDWPLGTVIVTGPKAPYNSLDPMFALLFKAIVTPTMSFPSASISVA